MFTTQSNNKRGHYETILENQRELIEDAQQKVHNKEVAKVVFQQKLAVFRVHEAEYRNIVDLAEIAKQKVQFMDEDLQDFRLHTVLQRQLDLSQCIEMRSWSHDHYSRKSLLQIQM